MILFHMIGLYPLLFYWDPAHRLVIENLTIYLIPLNRMIGQIPQKTDQSIRLCYLYY